MPVANKANVKTKV